jgi:hypothetical protein
MDGPDRRYRTYIAEQADGITTEDAVDGLLAEIAGAVREDARAGQPADDLASVEAWAALASYAVGRYYGPSSPLRKDIAGWSNKAVERLREIANVLAERLRALVGYVGATGFSVAVGFPWGISIALNW